MIPRGYNDQKIDGKMKKIHRRKYQRPQKELSLSASYSYQLACLFLLTLSGRPPSQQQQQQLQQSVQYLVEAIEQNNFPGRHCNCVGCTIEIWNRPTTSTDTGETFTCGQRIAWLQSKDSGLQLTEYDACVRVAHTEFDDIPTECGLCDPMTCVQPPTGAGNGGRCGGCTECVVDSWDTIANDHSCGSRITWLQTTTDLPTNQLRTESEACAEVATQFPTLCASCDPASCSANGNNQETSDNPTPNPTPSPQPTLQNPTTVQPTAAIASPPPTELPTQTSPATNPPTASGNGGGGGGTSDICGFGPWIGCTFDQQSLMPPQHIRPDLISKSFLVSNPSNDVAVTRIKQNRQTGPARPIPTSKWWTNMIGPTVPGPTTSTGNADPPLFFPVFSHPYRIIFNDVTRGKNDYGIHVCYSADYRSFIDTSTSNGVPKGYFHGSASDWVFSATEFDSGGGSTTVGPPTVEIVDWDDAGFGFTVNITPLNSNDSLLTTDIVVGMPFVTARYQNMTPKLSTIHAILTVDGSNVNLSGGTSTTSFSSTKFVITNNKGQRWVVYSSQTIEFFPVGSSPGSHLEATTSYEDITLRIAILPDGVDDSIYDPYMTCIVTGGAIDVIDSDTYVFNWATRDDCSNGVVHFGFPHQGEVLDLSAIDKVDGLTLSSTTRGTMQAYATRMGQSLQWTLKEPNDIPMDGFFPPRNPDPSLIDQFNVRTILSDEINEEFVLDGGSYYFSGKAAQKYATLCLLASDSNVNTDPTLLDTCIVKLQTAVDILLSNRLAYPLVYDEVYRGLTSSGGFVLNDINADFGNTVYNDHHFHWGYWIFVGAVLKELSPSWNRIDELNAIIELFLRDTINSDSIADPEFPTWRHFDWFSGHSSSHGLVPFFDGKDQESTSEEMNFHYSVYLWGKVSGNAQLESLGKLCMKICARSVGKYLLMEDDNNIHPQIVKNKVVGIFFENKVDYTTWFGSNEEFIHGIQMIPVSPVNELLRTDSFVRQEWDSILQNNVLIASPDLHCNNGWQSLLYCNYAVIDPVGAMQNLSFATMDGGLSRAWALYYAATRPSSGTADVGGGLRSSSSSSLVEPDSSAADRTTHFSPTNNAMALSLICLPLATFVLFVFE